MSAELYLDHNAGSPLRPEALAAMLPFLKQGAVNPSSLHRSGQAGRAALETARARVAASLGGRTADWVFTGGATEACNLALRGLCSGPSARPLLVGATEHPAVLECALALQHDGARVEILPVRSDGVVDLENLERVLQRQPGALVALMLANNETGVLHPIERVSALTRKAGGLLFCDLAQAAGKMPVDVGVLGLDLAAASASKFGGPQGVGLLFVAPGLTLVPLLYGGHQEGGRRPGTENVAGAVGAAEALAVAVASQSDQAGDWLAACVALRSGLERARPGVLVHGEGAPRVPNTLCVSLVGVDRDLLLMRLDQAGLRASAGAACAAGAAQDSHVLAAMGASAAALKTEIRFSFGPGQGEAEALDACRRLAQAVPGAIGFQALGPGGC